VTCYTDELGKVTAVAKSALKHTSKQAMHLDLLNLVDFELVNGRATHIITSAQSERTYQRLKRSLSALASASFFLEVFDKMVFEHQPDERLWSFLTGLLDELDGDTGATFHGFRSRQSHLLGVLGYLPAGRQLPTGDDVSASPAFSDLDARFEHLSGLRFVSLPFIYSVIK
jgi:DNA repair protein RecO (recombination protein O)